VRKKSLKTFEDKVRGKTGRTRGDSLERIIQDFNRTLRGWFEYFKSATRSRSAASTASFADGFVLSCASR
jgi:RNA-directed DNA polymerase